MGGVLSRFDIDMFHEKPWAILTNLGNRPMATEDGPYLSGSCHSHVAGRAPKSSTSQMPSAASNRPDWISILNARKSRSFWSA